MICRQVACGCTDARTTSWRVATGGWAHGQTLPPFAVASRRTRRRTRVWSLQRPITLRPKRAVDLTAVNRRVGVPRHLLEPRRERCGPHRHPPGEPLDGVAGVTLVIALDSWLGRIIARASSQSARARSLRERGGRCCLADPVPGQLADGGAARDHRFARESERNWNTAPCHRHAPGRHLPLDRKPATIRQQARPEAQGLTPRAIAASLSEVVATKAFAIVRALHPRACLAGEKVEFEAPVPCQADELVRSIAAY